MQQLSQVKIRQDGNASATNLETRTPASKPVSTERTDRLDAAKKSASRLLDFLPPQNVGNAQAFIAGIVAIFANYSPAVMAAVIDPVTGIPSRHDRPTLRVIKEECEAANEPFLRAAEREDAQRQAHRARALPPPPRTPEQQARIDRQVAEMRADLGIPLEGLPPREVNLPPSADAAYDAAIPVSRNDGKHALRVKADLEARAAARKESQETTP